MQSNISCVMFASLESTSSRMPHVIVQFYLEMNIVMLVITSGNGIHSNTDLLINSTGILIAVSVGLILGVFLGFTLLMCMAVYKRRSEFFLIF